MAVPAERSGLPVTLRGPRRPPTAHPRLPDLKATYANPKHPLAATKESHVIQEGLGGIRSTIPIHEGGYPKLPRLLACDLFGELATPGL